MPTRIKWRGWVAIWDGDAAQWDTADEPAIGRGLTVIGQGYRRSAYTYRMGNTQALHLRDTLGVEILEQEGPDPDDKPGTIY